MPRLPPADDSLARIDVYVLRGKGHFPLAYAKIPGWVTPDLLTLIEEACTLDRGITPEACVRSVWRLGVAAFKRNTVRRIPVPPRDRVA